MFLALICLRFFARDLYTRKAVALTLALARHSCFLLKGPLTQIHLAWHWPFRSPDVTSQLKWPFDTPGAISCRCPIVTESVSPAIFEIMGPKDIEVTNRTFQGHVTSSITWPIDSPYAISYCCPIETKALSSTVFEIFGPKSRARTRTHTDTQTHAASDLYSVPCSILHWTDKNQKKISA